MIWECWIWGVEFEGLDLGDCIEFGSIFLQFNFSALKNSFRGLLYLTISLLSFSPITKGGIFYLLPSSLSTLSIGLIMSV